MNKDPEFLVREEIDNFRGYFLINMAGVIEYWSVVLGCWFSDPDSYILIVVGISLLIKYKGKITMMMMYQTISIITMS